MSLNASNSFEFAKSPNLKNSESDNAYAFHGKERGVPVYPLDTDMKIDQVVSHETESNTFNQQTINPSVPYKNFMSFKGLKYKAYFTYEDEQDSDDVEVYEEEDEKDEALSDSIQTYQAYQEGLSGQAKKRSIRHKKKKPHKSCYILAIEEIVLTFLEGLKWVKMQLTHNSSVESEKSTPYEVLVMKAIKKGWNKHIQEKIERLLSLGLITLLNHKLSIARKCMKNLKFLKKNMTQKES